MLTQLYTFICVQGVSSYEYDSDDVQTSERHSLLTTTHREQPALWKLILYIQHKISLHFFSSASAEANEIRQTLFRLLLHICVLSYSFQWKK